MLVPETAQKLLETFADAKFEEKRLARIKTLSQPLRSHGFALIGRNSEGKPFISPRTYSHKAWKEAQTARAATVQVLDSLASEERTQLFSAFCPKLGPVLNAAWEEDTYLFQLGAFRRAFRVPGRKDLTRQARFSQIEEFWNTHGLYAEQDLPWFATWIPYLRNGWGTASVAPVFAAAIRARLPEADEVFEILLSSARGEHETGMMGRHVTRTLLTADRPEGWEFMEKMLLAAQRQEGLRQDIFEAIDEAHPEAFRRMLKLIVEQDLLRFSSTLYAANLWFGFGHDVTTAKQVYKAIEEVSTFLEDRGALEKALASSENGQTVYLALWALGIEDAITAIPQAVALLDDSLVDRRAAGAYFLSSLKFPEASKALVRALDDPDLRIAALAFQGGPSTYYYQSQWLIGDEDDEADGEDGEEADQGTAATLGVPDYYERLARNIHRFPKSEKENVKPILFPWLTPETTAPQVAQAMVNCIGKRDINDLLPYLPLMDSGGRGQVVSLFADKKRPRTDANRDVLIQFLSDTSSYVRDAALEGLKEYPKDDSVIQEQFEKLLTRKSSELRQSLIQALLARSDAQALESAGRLLESKNVNQRTAGLDLLTQMAKNKRQNEKARSLAAAFSEKASARLTPAEKALLDPLLADEKEQVTLENALGLMDPGQMTRPVPPEPLEPAPLLASPSSVAILAGLVEFLEQHRELPIRVKKWDGSESDALLGNGNAGFPTPDVALPLEEDLARLPIRELLENWWNSRPEAMRDPDGLELLRLIQAYAHTARIQGYGGKFTGPYRHLVRSLYSDLTSGAFTYQIHHLVVWLMAWLERMEGIRPGSVDLMLAGAQTALAGAYQIERQLEAEGRLKTPEKKDGEEIDEDEDFEDFEDFDEDEDNVLTGLLNAMEEELEEGAELLALLNADETEDEDFEEDEDEEGKVPEMDQFRNVVMSLLTGIPLPDEPEDSKKKVSRGAWRTNSHLLGWLEVAKHHCTTHPEHWSEDQLLRLWRMLVWMDRPHPAVYRQRPDLEVAVAAFTLGAATEADLYDHLLGARPSGGYYGRIFDSLGALSGRKDHALVEKAPQLKQMVENCRQRILAIELQRGDLPTVATGPAQCLRYAGGADNLLRVLQAMGKEIFVRGYVWGDSRSGVFSQLIRATFPRSEDTPDTFAEQVKTLGISEQRLVETAMYAPQWAGHIERALGWDSLAEGVFWLHAHTRDDHWQVDEEIKNAWTAGISDRTPLTVEDLTGGAVDVAWFHRVWSALGEERWKSLDDAAKYSSSSGGHKRAQLFADAMRGRADKEEVITRIREKRNQDSLRALGLIPLPESEAERKAETLARYEIMQEFLRTSKKFGAQRQESEKGAVRIAMENLARTAGYTDPIRLEWAMEAEAVADLAQGAVSVTVGEVSVTLAINPLGEPDLKVEKKGKVVQNIPAAAKKDPAVAQLVERRKGIERQVSRMRASLEEAMVRGDVFTGAELAELLRHPILRPMLCSMAFITEAEMPRLGYPLESAEALEDCEGQNTPLAPDTRLRIAHPYDLLLEGRWDRWQKECFLKERVQPFKQVFRELYVLTDQERDNGTKSERYAGHQINPRQGMALFGKRGWVSLYEGEEVRKTFHQAGISAQVSFDGWTGTPADVEGMTMDHVTFTRRGEWEPMRLVDVPPRLFSEAMRDLDLVVSVAHMGGVDPEASASTVEMRAALVREAASLLKLENIRFQKSHILVDGKIGTYSIHLGSAIVHRQPGGYVCIVPVHSQHRGRVFLPFADNDPRTAEVVSKVLLLARDHEIKDPTILEQLAGV